MSQMHIFYFRTCNIIFAIADPMVAAAFAALSDKEILNSGSKSGGLASSQVVDDLVGKAKHVTDLLKIADQKLDRSQALKIVSVIAEWHSVDRIKLSEFENDPRFLKLCQLLGKVGDRSGSGPGGRKSRISSQFQSYRNEDLNTVLSVTGDDEAAKLISNINLEQMIKIMSSLAQKRRRSVPLLRSLATNITSKSEQIEPKKCADLLYAMSVLNFYDQNLINRICGDFQKAISTINTSKSAVIGSICTSLGLIKHRDSEFMEVLGKWLVEQKRNARPQDVSAFIFAAAVLNLRSELGDEIQKEFSDLLVREDFIKSTDYLNHIWALTLLGWSSEAQLQSVFNQNFLDKLFYEAKINPALLQSVKMKLLNVNAASKLFLKGNLVDIGESFDMDWNSVNKSKQILIGSLMDTLNTLLPSQKTSSSADLIRTNYDTKMGFFIDAICVLDPKRTRLPVDSTDPNATR